MKSVVTWNAYTESFYFGLVFTLPLFVMSPPPAHIYSCLHIDVHAYIITDNFAKLLLYKVIHCNQIDFKRAQEHIVK